MKKYDTDEMFELLTGIWRRAEELGQAPIERNYYTGYPTLTVGDTTLYTKPGRGVRKALDEITRDDSVLFFFEKSDGSSVTGFWNDNYGSHPRSWTFERFADEFRLAFQFNYKADEAPPVPSP